MLKAARRILCDPAFLAAVVAATASGFLLYHLHGLHAVHVAIDEDLRLFVWLICFVPPILLLSAFVQVMMPKGLIERWLGVSSGMRGIFIATLAGAFTPGGPFMAFPLVQALYRAGADWAPLIAYTTAWLLLSVMRMLVFEIPMVGVELPTVRFTACLLLPAFAGLSARYIARLYRPPAQSHERTHP